MNIRSLLTTSAIAGVVMALLSHLPLISFGNLLICMWLWGSGIFGAWLYRRLDDTSLITPGQGAVVGALSGVVAAFAGAAIGAFVGGVGLAGLAASQGGSSSDILGNLAVAGGFSLLGLLFNIFLYPTFGAIGGAIGGVVFGDFGK